jgi:L,D-peptidoglycan transpeptidase YkuD (ErfK/YbiS/YcfS/YnhG family)
VRTSFKFIFLVLSAHSLSVAHANQIDESRQCIVVFVPDWKAHIGELHAFERSEGEGQWRSHGDVVPVVLGSDGLAWGRGFMRTWNMFGTQKQEGDNKTPAGLFRLGSAFGYAPPEEASWIKIPYINVTHHTVGVDDPRSKFYNRIVERTKIDNPDWKTSEGVMRDEDVYRWGAVIEHNSDPIVPGAGSCIYLHVWRDSTIPTAGCIAMAETNLVSLLRWLDPDAKPFLIAVPKKIYPKLPQEWNLPLREWKPSPKLDLRSLFARPGRGR